MIENLPEPFRTGMKTSNLWAKEKKRGGLEITNCLSMYLPESMKTLSLWSGSVTNKDITSSICSGWGTQILQSLRKALQKKLEDELLCTA